MAEDHEAPEAGNYPGLRPEVLQRERKLSKSINNSIIRGSINIKK